MTTWQRILMTGLFGGVAAALVAWTSTPVQARTERVQGPVVVQVAQVTEAPATRTVRLLGVTRAADRSQLSFTLGGRLQQRGIDVGDTVVAGQVLARLDPLPLAHQVDEARAQADDVATALAQVRADRQRLERLRVDELVSEAELERVQSQETSLAASLARAEVGLAEAERQQREAVLRAPFDGVVTAVFAEAGETLAAGQPLVALSGSGVEIALEAPEGLWARLDRDVPVHVELPGVGCDLPGTITHLAPAAGGPSALFPVHVAVPTSDTCRVVPGLTARVDFEVDRDASLAVPLRAVVDPSGDGAVVMRVHAGRVQRVSVDPIQLDADRVAILGPLSVGDEVVVGGLVGLADGATVQVQR